MKIQLISYVSALLVAAAPAVGIAQARQSEPLTLGAIAPYSIEVSYDRTSHIIFPSGIRYVDLGSNYIVAGKADDADNVLRVKAAVAGFDQQTNFSVITEDGIFYGFNVCYNEQTGQLSYDLGKGEREANKERAAGIQFEDLGKVPASLPGLLMQAIYKNNKSDIRDIRAASHGVAFRLKGIYVHNGMYYFHTELSNDTFVPFVTDFITFKVADRKVAKRTVMQEKELNPVRTYLPLSPVKGKGMERNVYLLEVFTLSEGQVLLIEAFEKNGGRTQQLRVSNAELVRAKPLEQLRLKM